MKTTTNDTLAIDGRFSLNTNIGQIHFVDEIFTSLKLAQPKISIKDFAQLFDSEYQLTVIRVLSAPEMFLGAKLDLKLHSSSVVSIKIVKETPDEKMGNYLCEIHLNPTPVVDYSGTAPIDTCILNGIEFEAINDAIYNNTIFSLEIYNAHGDLLDINNMCMKIFGIADKDDVRGINIFNNPNIPLNIKLKLINREDCVCNLMYDFDLAKSYFNTSNNGVKCITIFSSTLRNSDNKVAGYIVMGYDVSEHKQDAKSVYYKFDLISKIYDKLPVGIELFDRNGILIDANQKIVDMFGLPDINNLLGYNIFNDPNLTSERKEKFRQGVDFEYSTFYDTRRRVERSNTPNNEGTISITVNVTYLRNNHNELDGFLMVVRHSDEWVRNGDNRLIGELLVSELAETAKIGVAELNLLANQYKVSDQWRVNMMGSHSCSYSHSIIWENLHPDDNIKLVGLMKRALHGELITGYTEVRLQDPITKWRWLACHYKVSEYNPQHGAINVIIINQDITDQKEREANLTKAKIDTEAVVHMKSRFISNMHKEMSAILDVIDDFVTYSDSETTTNEHFNTHKQAYPDTKQIRQLLSGMFNLADDETEHQGTVISEFSLNSLIKYLENTYMLRSLDHLKLEFLPVRSNCVVRADKALLIQAVSKLIDNAIKFTDKGLIRVGSVIYKDDIVIYVADTGIGIPENKFSYIFDRYSKLDMDSDGEGVGLSDCKSIVKQLGGTVGIDSTVGVGSRFWITLKYDYIIGVEDRS